MKTYQLIIDTNVLVAALHSKQGASFLLLKLLNDGDERWQINVSTALILESVDYIITYNMDDFARAKMFGVDAITPKTFLQKIGEIT